MRRPRADRRVPIYNFVNRTPRPWDAPYSVKVTDCRDWRGGQWTYDGHLGTDFACPIGTPVVAAAPGVVTRVAVDLAMGGRKVCIDHGAGLFTTSNHLARALVAEGDSVGRGDVVGLSGVSGLEFVFFFPWVSPHLHFNVWLDGAVADPFARSEETSIWLSRNDPIPVDEMGERGGAAASPDKSFTATNWDEAALEKATALCRDPDLRAEIEKFDQPARRAAELLVLRNYRPALFEDHPPLYSDSHERRPTLDLPFRSREYVGISMPEDGVPTPTATNRA